VPDTYLVAYFAGRVLEDSGDRRAAAELGHDKLVITDPFTKSGLTPETLDELLKLARREKLSYASGGPGVPGHLAAELLLSMTGASMLHVPYKGPAAATADVMGGQVNCGFLATPTVLRSTGARPRRSLGAASALGRARSSFSTSACVSMTTLMPRVWRSRGRSSRTR